MGGVTGDNIEGLNNFAARALGAGVGTTILVASKKGMTPIVESVVLSLDAAAVAATAAVENSSGSDGVRVKADINTVQNLIVSRIKMEASPNDAIQLVVAGTGAVCDVHIDGRWIANEPNFS